MGEKIEHQGTRTRLEEVSQDWEVRSADRGHIIKLKNMSIQEIYDMAYQQGFEDGMSFVTTPKIAHG